MVDGVGPPIPLNARVSLSEDADGSIVAATATPDAGELRVARQKGEPGLALAAWREV